MDFQAGYSCVNVILLEMRGINCLCMSNTSNMNYSGNTISREFLKTAAIFTVLVIISFEIFFQFCLRHIIWKYHYGIHSINKQIWFKIYLVTSRKHAERTKKENQWIIFLPNTHNPYLYLLLAVFSSCVRFRMAARFIYAFFPSPTRYETH